MLLMMIISLSKNQSHLISITKLEFIAKNMPTEEMIYS